MRLFDDNVRTYGGIREPQESIYQFLNRSAHPKYEEARNLLEKWFQDYPEASHLDLSKRMHSKLDKDHLSAFFELYCHAWLHHQGFVVKPHQIVDATKKTRIDFLVQSANTPLFYFEVKVAMDVDMAPASRIKLRELENEFDTFQEPNFWIELHIEQESTNNLPIKKMRLDIHDWLQTLDPDEISRERATSTKERWPYYELDGWKIVFIAIPKPVGIRGKPGKTILEQSSPVQWRNELNSLQKALKDKAKKYGKFELPCVIAVDVLAINSLGCDIEEVLFGQEVVLFDRETEEVTMTRSPLLPTRPSEENGFWVARRGPRNQQVSALLLVDELMPWSVASRTPVLWHNPWAEKPLDPNIWQGPQMILDKDAPEPYMQERVGKQSYEIFHLHHEEK